LDFFKRHFEKLLLLLMLVLFIGIMVYVVSVAEQAKSIKDSALTFKEGDLRKNLVEQKNAAAPEYSVSRLLQTGKSQQIKIQLFLGKGFVLCL
jgi:uncharacterized protein (UPF0333 family)